MPPSLSDIGSAVARLEENISNQEDLIKSLHEKVDKIPCGRHEERIRGNLTAIKVLWGFVSGIVIVGLAAFFRSLVG